jgi:hypothetical protein
MSTNEYLLPHPSTVSGASTLQAGDRVSVHHRCGLHYRAIVEERMPTLNVVWVRELSTGDRKMVSTDEHDIVRH